MPEPVIWATPRRGHDWEMDLEDGSHMESAKKGLKVEYIQHFKGIITGLLGVVGSFKKSLEE